MNYEERLNAVRMMHETMLSMNNEDAYMAWIWVMPDGANEDDFEFFADKDEFADLKRLFDGLFDHYKKDGLFEPEDEVLEFLNNNGYSLENVDILYRR